MSSHKMVCFSNKKGNNKVVLYLAVHHGCMHTHTSEREPYKLHCGCERIHTIRKETLSAVHRGCGVTHTF